jgi:hypothetical protein
MNALAKGSIYLFEGFRLDRHARVLFRRDEGGTLVPIAIGSRAFEVLDVLVGRAGTSYQGTNSWLPYGRRRRSKVPT